MEEETTWLEEMLRCPVCHDILTDPRQLPCGHSMCMSCVEKLLDHSSEAPLRCPDCRTDFGRLVGLQRSYTLSSIAEDFRLNHKTKENQRRSVYCDYCPDGVTLASKTCLKCEVSLCKEHVKDHLELPVFTGHPLVKPLGDLTERRCRQHEDQVLRYYCTSSRRYVCNICALESKQLNAAADASTVLRRQLTVKHLLKQLHNLPEEDQGTVPLDLDTTRCSLGVSADLQTESVEPKQDYLQSKRCTDDARQVLSSQCFSSGAHVWEVEAEGRWDISVFSKSVQGKGKDSSTCGTNSESWSLKHNGKGSLSAYHNKTQTLLAATLNSSRIAVVVNFEEGRIVFSAVDFTVTQLHEFKAELTQPVCLNVGVHVGDAHSRASIVRTA